jgi:glycosyltransferase 2 family protein
MKSILVTIAKTAVTALLLYFLFRRVDFEQFWRTLRGARFALLALGFALLWVGHYLCVVRWRMLMRPLMPVLSFGQALSVYCIGLFFNLAFPTVIGGDVVKMYYAGRPSKLYAESFASTFLDRDAGMLGMMIIACVVTLLHPVTIPRIPIALIIWGTSALFVLANLAIFTPAVHDVTTGALRQLGLTRMASKIDALSRAFQTMRREGALLAGSLVISVVNQVLVIALTWVMAEGLRLDVGIVYFLIFIPVITLVSMIPVSLNGMGLREYAYVSLFTAVGLSTESAIALGLLASAVVILSAVPGGILYVFFKHHHGDVREMAALEANVS